jgi:hypothetical protein
VAHLSRRDGLAAPDLVHGLDTPVVYTRHVDRVAADSDAWLPRALYFLGQLATNLGGRVELVVAVRLVRLSAGHHWEDLVVGLKTELVRGPGGGAPRQTRSDWAQPGPPPQGIGLIREGGAC